MNITAQEIEWMNYKMALNNSLLTSSLNQDTNQWEMVFDDDTRNSLVDLSQHKQPTWREPYKAQSIELIYTDGERQEQREKFNEWIEEIKD